MTGPSEAGWRRQEGDPEAPAVGDVNAAIPDAERITGVAGVAGLAQKGQVGRFAHTVGRRAERIRANKFSRSFPAMTFPGRSAIVLKLPYCHHC